MGWHNLIYFNCYLHSRKLHPKVEPTQKFRGALESPKKESLLQRLIEILVPRLQRFPSFLDIIFRQYDWSQKRAHSPVGPEKDKNRHERVRRALSNTDTKNKTNAHHQFAHLALHHCCLHLFRHLHSSSDMLFRKLYLVSFPFVRS